MAIEVIIPISISLVVLAHHWVSYGNCYHFLKAVYLEVNPIRQESETGTGG